MALPLSPAIALARLAGTLSRLRGGGATSVPGVVLNKLRPDAIAMLASRLSHTAVVSATNGKTTTSAMAADILEAHGERLVHNSAGANMAGGIASTLMQAQREGTLGGALGLFEVDEAWLPRLAVQLCPQAVLLGNLFRDQLDRYGELESIAMRWNQAMREGPGAEAKLVLNADDPMVADIGRGRESVLYFGIEDKTVALADMAHAADATHCRRCGAAYEFEAIYLGHLGDYHCPSCGQRRPKPTVFATEIALQGVRSTSFTLTTPSGQARVVLPLPGLYNLYNALAAAALTSALGVGHDQIAATLSGSKPAFGRAEIVSVQGRPLQILLVKNPAGTNEVLRTLALEPGEHDLLGILNDRVADGRDVSWIWDADFELLARRVRRFTCSGTRAPELALRLKYAGVAPNRIVVCESISDALDVAAADRPAGKGEAPLYALPTYTAMLELRELLVGRGEADRSWT